MSNFGDWMPGAKEGKLRADAVSKRRYSAAALTTDLDLDMQDLTVSLQLDQKDFQSEDFNNFRATVERAQAIMEQIYNDISMIANKPVPERITEAQAYEYLQPALRVEARVTEARKWITKAQEARKNIGKPRDDASGIIADAENRRLQAEIERASIYSIVQQLKMVHAENYPKVEAAFLTAENEFKAASQMVASARQALGQRRWREAMDLAKRSVIIFDSAAGKFDLIRTSEADYNRASQDADDALAKAIQNLNDARTLLQAQAGTLANDPNFYLQAPVQRLGEARRAFKANPPQYVTALRLANDSLGMIEAAINQASDEGSRIRQARLDARRSLEMLNDMVEDLRITLNSQRTVPVRANELYAKARMERDRLLPRHPEIERLNLPQLTELTVIAKLAMQSAEKALKLLNGQ